MKMNIGIKIKKFRHERDLTQEQLAEYLYVSVPAVSQWESGKTVPDVTTLLALANFFDVTLDELFDRAPKEKEKEMEKYYALDKEYSNQGNVKNLLSLWREASQKYPGDFNCLIKLAYSLEGTVYIGGESEEIERNANVYKSVYAVQSFKYHSSITFVDVQIVEIVLQQSTES